MNKGLAMSCYRMGRADEPNKGASQILKSELLKGEEFPDASPGAF
jgi:hypothetical protein